MNEVLPLKILFLILGFFILFNLFVSILLNIKLRRQSEFVTYLSPYWGSLLIVFFLQGLGQGSYESIILAFSTNIIPLIIITSLCCKTVNYDLPKTNLFLIFSIGLFASLYLKVYDIPFYLKALPLAFGVGLPMMINAWVVFTTKNTHTMTKLLAASITFGLLPLTTWLFFRMVPGTQFWGWVFPFAGYQMIALALICYTIFDLLHTENLKLEGLVQERTQEINEKTVLLEQQNSSLRKSKSNLELLNFKLAKTKEQNDILLKAVVHDIGTPLTIIGSSIKNLINRPENSPEKFLESISKSSTNLNNIVTNVKDRILKGRESASLNLDAVSIVHCFEEINFSFKDKLQDKNIQLVLDNELDANTYFLADSRSIVNSVLNNFVSNAIKFSFENSRIIISASEIDQDHILIKVKDFGTGMTKDVLRRVMDPTVDLTSVGTLNEKGTGFGVSIAKDYITTYGGQLRVESASSKENPEYHGTTFYITLKRAELLTNNSTERANILLGESAPLSLN